MKNFAGRGLPLFLIILAALALRMVLLLTCLDTVNADQAVTGLMGMHVLKGSFPNFIWEYNYAGALIAYLAAINFKLFGVSILSFKLSTFPLLVINIFFTCKLAARLYGRASGLTTGLLLAVSPVFVTLFEIDPRGSYPETLALGAVLLYLAYIFSEEGCETDWKGRSAVLGLLSGFAFWVSPLIIPYLAASWLVFLGASRASRTGRLLLLAGFCVLGCAPLVIYNIRHPFATFLSLGSRPFDASRVDLMEGLISAGPWKMSLKYISHYLRGFPSAAVNVFTGIFSIFSLANPPAERFGALGYAVGAVYLAPLCYFTAKTRKLNRSEILVYLAGSSVLFALFGSLGYPRYLLPLWPAAAVLLAVSLVRMRETSRALAVSILLSVLSVNLGGTFLCAGIKSPSYEKLAAYLSANDLRWGYAGYWTAYPLMFVSGEKIIVSPTLDLRTVHPRSKGAYPFYTDAVDVREKVFYITNDDGASVAVFEEKAAKLKLGFKKAPVPPFMVYYSFSRRIYPADLDLPASAAVIGDPFFY
ncbi:MAG: glycosyltransferase family 39 protein [Elusimicrobiales bacterium]|jgi:hypothetical protein